MTDKELQEARNKYNELLAEKLKLKEMKQRILELEQEPKVKEYLNLVEIYNKDSEDIIEKQIYNEMVKIAEDTEKSNKLLFDYGYCSMTKKDSLFSQRFHVYRDLETSDYYYASHLTIKEIKKIPFCYTFFHINYEEMCNFESKNQEFMTVRKYFFTKLMNEPQEEVVEELLKNNKQLVKGK